MSDSQTETVLNDPINRQHLDEITGGDKEFAEELLEEYLSSTGKLVEDLRAIIDDVPDYGKLYSLGHAIKGSSLSVGADQVSAAAKKIEENARADSADNLATHFAVIDENVCALKQMQE